MKNFLKSVFANLTAMAIAAGAFALFCVLIIVAIASLSQKPAPVVVKGSILVFDMSANVQDAPVSKSGEEVINEALGKKGVSKYSLLELSRAIRKAAEDDRIKGMLLQGSFSPKGNGAGFSALRDLRASIEAFSDAGKPIWAYVVYPSARDFYIVSSADTIYMNPEGLLANAGMSMTMPFIGGFMEKYGIGVQVTKAGEYKSAAEMFVRQDMSEASRRANTALLEDMWQEYLEVVAPAAGMEPQALQDLIDKEGMLSARKALEHGLVDKLAFVDELIGDLKQAGKPTSDGLTFQQVKMGSYLAASRQGQRSSEGHVAVLYAEGGIVTGEGDSGQVGGDRIGRLIRQLRQKPETKAIVLRVNSPGGSALASEVIQHELRLAQEAGIPVVVSMGSVAASGGYWISAYANRIYAQPNTITGSIGVIGMFMNAQDLGKRHGVSFDTVKTARFADSLNVTRPKTEEEMGIIQSWVDETYDAFLRKVSEGRGLPLERVKEIAQGRVWSGSDALEIGLVDELGGLEEAIAHAGDLAGLGKTPAIKELPEAKNFFEELAETMQGGGVSVQSDLAAELLETYRSIQSQVSLYNDPRGVYMVLPNQPLID